MKKKIRVKLYKDAPGIDLIELFCLPEVRCWKSIVWLQVITLEGWVDIMYFVMDSHSFYNFIYFILLIIVSNRHNYYIITLKFIIITYTIFNIQMLFIFV